VYRAVNAIPATVLECILPASLTKVNACKDQVSAGWGWRFEHAISDCHRWKIAEQTDKAPVYGMNVSAGSSLKDDIFTSAL